MIIQNVDALKEWLTKTLTPICDADPQTLAKYVLALVKKEKSEPDLRDLCTRELDVFLTHHTKEFVEELFRNLKNKGYLAPATSSVASSLPKSVSNVSSTTSAPVSSTKQNSQDPVDKNGPSEYSAPPLESVSSTRQDRSDRHRLESSGELKDRHYGRSRSHSRSPIPRNRSPVKDLRDRLDRDDRKRRYSERRRDYDRAPPRRFSNRYDGPYRRVRRSPFRTRSRSRTRSREKFVGRGRSRSRSRSRSARPRTRSRSRSFSDSRSRSESPRGRRKPSSRSSTPPDYRLPEEHPPETKPVRPRCRDYDEKGFCMRGDLCPFDHGSDPVVVDDVNLPNVLGFPGGSSASGSVPSMATHQGGHPPGHTHPGAPPVGTLPMMGPRPLDNVSNQPLGAPPPGSRPPGPPNIGGPTISARLGPVPCTAAGMLPPGGPPQLCIKGPQNENTPPPPGTVPINMPPQQVMYRSDHTPGYAADPPYNPEAPSIQGSQTRGYWTGSGNVVPPVQHVGHGQSLPTRRDLRSIPTVTEDTTGNVQRTVIASKHERDGGQNFQNHNRQNFDPNRHGPRRNHETSSTTLEVKKIPREYNNIAKLYEHFGKFGTIVHLQVQYGGNPEAALITFVNHAQANAAYRSSEPVFNNRFIKVFWHRPGATTPDSGQGQTGEGKPSVRERLGGIPPAHKMQLNNMTKRARLDSGKETIVVSPTGSVTKTLINPSAAGNKPPVHCRLGTKLDPSISKAELEKKKALRAEELKEAMNKKLEIRKQKQALLEKQIGNQKLLFKKLEKKTLSPEDKAALIQTIKSVANSIDKLKLELKDPVTGCLPSVTQSSTAPAKAAGDGDSLPTSAVQVEVNNLKDKQQTQKAILDTELDIISKESEGADTTELRRKVAELKRQAAAIGLIPPGRGRGRGAFRSRGRGRRLPMFRATLSVDRRPKQLLVSGYMQEEKEQLLEHLKMFGDVEAIESDDNVPNLLITYKTRAEAENAVYGGTMFQGRRLTMAFNHASSPDTKVTSLSLTPLVSTSVSGADSTQGEQACASLQEASNNEEQSQSNPHADIVLDVGVDILEEVQEGDEVLLESEDKELKEFDEDELLGEEEEEEEETRFWRH